MTDNICTCGHVGRVHTGPETACQFTEGENYCDCKGFNAQGVAAKSEPKAPEQTADQKKLEGLRKELSDLDGKAGEKRAEVAALVEKIANTPPKVKSQAELDKESAEAAEAERIKDIENARTREARKSEMLVGRGVL